MDINPEARTTITCNRRFVSLHNQTKDRHPQPPRKSLPSSFRPLAIIRRLFHNTADLLDFSSAIIIGIHRH
ncbi:hypothetical protein KP509_34G058700 [Ceratopteris richardii]|uniref:Uncharacterized protein n=1 Tax=Ceratopteris richardii TaxID=49495 RepID=A0A8T2QMA1_CERRI|nr:hypothetical protein KP509_34G058700 [Ceratopteris richardii]